MMAVVTVAGWMVAGFWTIGGAVWIVVLAVPDRGWRWVWRQMRKVSGVCRRKEGTSP
jgi:hypothetical protein